MTTTKIVIMVIVFLIALIALVVSALQFAQKGIPLNNTYLYAEDSYKARLCRKPLFIQSGITFLLIALTFACIGIYVLTAIKWFYVAEYIVLAITVIYAIISSIIISKKYGKM